MDFFPRKVSRLKSTLQNVGPASSERLYETISLSLLGKGPPQTSDFISQNMFVEQELFEWMRAAKAANFQIQGKMPGGL